MGLDELIQQEFEISLEELEEEEMEGNMPNMRITM